MIDDKEKDKLKNHDDIGPIGEPDAGTKNLKKKKIKSKLGMILTWSIIGAGILIFIIVAVATKNYKLLNTVFYDGLVNNILAVPSILLGLITFLGYLLQRKKWYNSLSGAIKTIVGYLILQSGSYILTGVSKPLMVAFGQQIGSSVILLDPYMGWTNSNDLLGEFVSLVSYVVLVGLLVNIILVALKKFTNVRSINVTGHIMFQQAATLVAVLYVLTFTGITNSAEKQALTVVSGGFLIGLYWGVFSNLALAPTNKITNNSNFTVGHQQMFGAWCAYQTGRMFKIKGKKAKSAEELSLPKSLSIFHDNIFSSAILMLIFFGTLFIILYSTNSTLFNDVVTNQIGGINQFKDKWWFIQVFGLSLEIVAALQILMMGARMFVIELQKSFIGISQKLIPGAVVAIDIAGTFSFGEKSVVYGFLSGALGNFIGIGLIIILGQVLHISAFNVVIMVGFICMFFDNGCFGLYANESGGWLGCIVVSFIFGILTTFGAVLAVKTTGIFTTGYNGMFDWNTLWALIFTLNNISGINVAPYMLILVAILFILVAQFTSTEIAPDMPIKRMLFGKFSKGKDSIVNKKINKKE